MFKTECHCGKVKLKSAEFPADITRCNCSICYRLGALWAYYPETEVKIEAAGGMLTVYAWGEEKMLFHRCTNCGCTNCGCTNCGCTTHYTSVEENGHKKIAINARMSDAEKIQHIQIRDFDGANSWKYF